MSGSDVIPPMPQKPDRSWESLKRKMREQPLVPIGCLITVGFLARGLRASKNGNKLTASQSMKGRVIAQGFTAVAVCAGIWWQNRERAAAKKTIEQKITESVENK